jgi:hypothetical protein
MLVGDVMNVFFVCHRRTPFLNIMYLNSFCTLHVAVLYMTDDEDSN